MLVKKRFLSLNVVKADCWDVIKVGEDKQRKVLIKNKLYVNILYLAVSCHNQRGRL